MLGNESDALDATQDTLVAALKALGRFDGRSSFGTWIYRIATNTCIDEIRRRRRRPVTGIGADVAEVADEISFGSAAPGLFVVPPPPGSDASRDHGTGSGGRSGGGEGARFGGVSGGRDPADIVAARLDIDEALTALPLEFRTAVVLRDVCDLPYDEIADILDVPVGTVRSRIARARTALAATWGIETTERGASSEGTPGGVAGNYSGTPDVRTTEMAPRHAPDDLSALDPSRRRRKAVTEQSREDERT
jgi:RNA polymerase sigma-70 factor (ECF subfamily)